MMNDEQKRALDLLNAMGGRPLRFLLVMPRFPPSFWGMCHLGPRLGRPGMTPSPGILAIAAMCPPEWELRVVDENVEGLTQEGLAWADLVGVTSMIVQYTSAIRVAQAARSMGKPTVVGGAHVTGEPAAYSPYFDVLVLNEGEITFRQFLHDYARAQVVSIYETDLYADLTETPVARYDLVRHPKRYTLYSVQYGRGCPHHCEFCEVVAMFGRKQRLCPVENVLGELEAIRRRGYRGPIFISDDNLTGNRSKALELCRGMAEWNRTHHYPFTYATAAAIDVAKDEEMLGALEEARVESVFLGLETPLKRSLESADKRHYVGFDFKDAIESIHRHRIRVDIGLIVGLDGDPPDIFERQLEFVEELGVAVAQLTILTALPASRLHTRLERERRLLFERTEIGFEGHAVYSLGIGNVIPKHFPPSALVEGYGRLVAGAYDPGNYFRRAVRQVSAMKPDLRNPRLLLRSLFVSLPLLTLFVLVCFPFRWQYLRAVLQVLVRCPTRAKEFKDVVLRGIHYLEFARLDVLPATAREAERLALLERGQAYSGRGSATRGGTALPRAQRVQR